MATCVAVIALGALIGWRTGSVGLTAVLPGDVALQPGTAIVLLLGATGLAASAGRRRGAAALVSLILLAACCLWLGADLARRPLSTDLLVFRDQLLAQRPAPTWPGRPSIITCVVITLFALALPGVNAASPWLRKAAVSAASVGALLATLSLLPHLVLDPTRVPVLHQDLRLALNTTVAVGLLCGGVLILMGDTGWVSVVSGRDERARIAWLLAPVALLPVVVGAAANLGVRAGYYGPDVRMLLIIELSACALLVLAFRTAQMLSGERGQRDRLASALEHAAVIVCTPQGDISYWPPACRELYGWTSVEAIGRRVTDLLGLDLGQELAISAAAGPSGEWRGELQQRTKSGEMRWFANRWTRHGEGLHGDARLVGTIIDITELKRAEAALRDSQERLHLAVDASDIGIADADIATGALVAEPGFERLLGLPPGGLQGELKNLNALVVALSPTRDADIAAKKPQQFDDVRLRRADGVVRDFHGVRRFFYAPDGTHVRTIGAYRDVTEERRAQVELEQRGDRLTELRSELAHVSRLSAMGEMAAALAHELNQPLTAIGNSVGALKIMLGDAAKPVDAIMRERVVRAANQAEGQAQRAGEIVRRLRDFIARGEADATIERLDPLIKDAVALAAPNAKSEGIEISLDLSPRAQAILADRIQIQQILFNLIRNAGEAMRDSPVPHRLVISTKVRRGMAEVSVRDNGPGVGAAVADTLFSPFLSTKNDGMGVGLSICRRIVEAHGGRMWLEPSARGADFRFTIPLARRTLSHAA